MKNFRIIEVEKFKNTFDYELIEQGVFKYLKDEEGYSTFRIAMSMEQEAGENAQYPLEDILDNFFIHIEEFLESKERNIQRYILGGELDDIRNLKSILGKRAYNKEFVDEEGQTRVKLIIQ